MALKDFVIPNTELIPEEVRGKVKKWSDYIDYWAVDWDFQNDTFMQGWVAFRTRKERKLPLTSDPHTYDKPGKYRILVKVIDIFGNDTSQALDVEAPVPTDYFIGKLHELMGLPTETEWVEFKEAKNNFDFDDLGRYFSALSNEANLNGQPAGWLIFGVTNQHTSGNSWIELSAPEAGIGKAQTERFQNKPTTRLPSPTIHELMVEDRRVVLFRIPPAPSGVPTTWRGHPLWTNS
ncbi:MAG: ATP-binding protein [Deltaproteobacteria bacterium]|nr:ATP-binding protein [Deltaproteobacteria bacterium]